MRPIALLLDLPIIIASALLAHAGYYELFANVPRVHVARWPDPWAMPKSALAIMLVSALISLISALLLVTLLRSSAAPSVVRAARIAEIAAFLVSLAACASWIGDFMDTAGRFG